MTSRPRHDKQDRLATDNTAGYEKLFESPDFAAADQAAGHIAGDPLGESDALVALQNALYDKKGAVGFARALSIFGEHSLGWVAVGVIGAAVDYKRRECWLGTAGLAFGAHATSVIIKRVVRRLRPHDERIRIGVEAPSKLSFPSSHCTSTTTALICISQLTGCKSVLAGVPVMAASRMLLGVHYPTDVAAGVALGAAAAGFSRKFACPAP